MSATKVGPKREKSKADLFPLAHRPKKAHALIMENDIDLSFAILACDPFGCALPADPFDYSDASDWVSSEFDVALDMVQTAIINYYFIDS